MVHALAQRADAAVAEVDSTGQAADILALPDHLEDALWRVEAASRLSRQAGPRRAPLLHIDACEQHEAQHEERQDREHTGAAVVLNRH